MQKKIAAIDAATLSKQMLAIGSPSLPQRASDLVGPWPRPLELSMAGMPSLLTALREALIWPFYPNKESGNEKFLASLLAHANTHLGSALAHITGGPTDVAAAFFAEFPRLLAILCDDVEAAFAGDPAAQSRVEVIDCYPGFLAVLTYRLAHCLLELGVPVLPRLLSEYAHSCTGIDIHPGASIGRGFFIDHGTGVVIGETCVVGEHVKLYQGVTLGALSVVRSPAGAQQESAKIAQQVGKRHPTLQDRVVVYANATILGGDTVIGHDAVIGSGVWLRASVPPFSLVVLEKSSHRLLGPEARKALNYEI